MFLWCFGCLGLCFGAVLGVWACVLGLFGVPTGNEKDDFANISSDSVEVQNQPLVHFSTRNFIGQKHRITRWGKLTCRCSTPNTFAGL